MECIHVSTALSPNHGKRRCRILPHLPHCHTTLKIVSQMSFDLGIKCQAATVAGSSECCGASAAAGDVAARRITFVLRPLAVWIVAPVAMPTSVAVPAKLKLNRLQHIDDMSGH